MSSVRAALCPKHHAWMRLVLLCLAVAAGPGRAAPPSAHADILEFSIPAQPLANALVVFSKRASKDVLYDSGLARGRMSSTVRGFFSPGDALNKLLVGTGLVERYADSSSFVVLPEIDGNVPGETTRSIEGSVIALDTMHVERSGDYRAYGSLIKIELQRALQKNPRTRSGKIKARADLWVDASGTVQRAQLSGSTGDVKKDADVLSVLAGFAVSQPPPADLPQPVNVSIDIEPL